MGTDAAASLAKLKLPDNEESRQAVIEASNLARDGDIKGANKALRDAVGSKAITPALQRQVLGRWAAGQYDLVAAETRPAAPAPAPNFKKPTDAKVEMVMKEHSWSRKEAEKYVDEGGLDMEKMQSEMEHPMDAQLKKMKENGPPQWFIDMFNEKQEEMQAEMEAAGYKPEALGDAGPPASAPAALAPMD
eukprot:TRINITY_DN14874_c0_g1_i1.p1 TRINITY_DN14874_c0_g1~~TRINITY_DN14874_c0_g1_i1.p1  ORF type:complete len:190 (+),score=71.83 TRINITY_DN14874_c0_g1_i1:244-813(+)